MDAGWNGYPTVTPTAERGVGVTAGAAVDGGIWLIAHLYNLVFTLLRCSSSAQ